MRPGSRHWGFLLAAYERMKQGPLDPDQKRFLRNEAFRGWEIVDATARLCAMNLLLHGISAPECPSRWSRSTTRCAPRRPSTSTWC